jgi:hypothetical protein
MSNVLEYEFNFLNYVVTSLKIFPLVLQFDMLIQTGSFFGNFSFSRIRTAVCIVVGKRV